LPPKQPPPPFWLTRTTGELVILGLAITVILMLLGAGMSIIIFEAIDPDTDTNPGLVVLSDILNTLIGVIAGYLAGRQEAPKVNGQEKRSTPSG
jgi:ABC-type Na+ efflux pump permease subunit